MKLEDIKVGETYNVRVKVEEKGSNGCWLQARTGEHGCTLILRASEAEAFFPITPHPVPTGGTLHQSDDSCETKQKNLFNHLNGRKNTETAPKYDQNRLFRKGDKVRFKEYHGRKAVMYSGTNSWFNHPPSCKNGILVVKEDEKESRVKIGIITADCAHATTAPCYLELVTPVEEQEPYSVQESIFYKSEWQVWKRSGDKTKTLMATYACSHPHAKEAAEAERDRLNEEYRKEMEK